MANRIPVMVPTRNLPCDGQWHVLYWVNDTGQTIYVKKIQIHHQASATMIADIHLTVFHGFPGGSRPVMIAPWDRYDWSPKVPAEVDFGADYYELPAGEHLAFAAACTVLSSEIPVSLQYHLPQPQFWYTLQP